jgi:hypothetical protein
VKNENQKETNNNVGAKNKKRNQNNKRNKIPQKKTNTNNHNSSNNNNASNEIVQPTINPLNEKPAKVTKKVKFHDDVKIIERIGDDESLSEDNFHQLSTSGATTSMAFPLEAQDHSISSTIDGSISEDSDSVGVLGRIAVLLS